MKISLKWLSDYIDVSEFFANPEKLDELLTSAGLEVEGIENRARQFDNVVVGHILEKGQHPDADKLSLCKVVTTPAPESPDAATASEIHQIVCGAKNHKQGDKVVVALVGAVLPGDFKIKKSKIRGVESNGMLCSEKEVGLASESEGIMILPADAPVGQKFAEYQGIDDIIFDLSVTPNRADCLSHLGLAREISALLNRPLKLPDVSFQESSDDTRGKIKVELKDAELCPRYTGQYVSDVKIGDSPLWLKQRLESVDINSINNMVDITNYVMLELGQPMHAFDADRVAGQVITIDKAKSGEKFTTLDGTELELEGEELMIRDGEKPVALAGVVGGLNSGVTDETKNIFFESAHFGMSTVRKTARKFGVETDSGYRFSRGTNPEGCDFALKRACHLAEKIAGGKAFSNAWDEYPKPIEPKKIDVSLDFISGKLGYEADAKTFKEWMERLGCEVSEKGTNEWSVTAPTFRWDLAIPEDLVEEYARLNGYDKIPESLPPLATMPSSHVSEYSLEKSVRETWAGIGYQQAVNHSFISSAWLEKILGDKEKLKAFGLPVKSEPVKLRNPISEELNVMRTALAPGLLKNVIHNYRYGAASGRLFEIGKTFFKSNDGYGQESKIGLASWGANPGLWQKDSSPLVLELKSNIESFLASLKSKSFRWQEKNMEEVPDFLHPGQAANLFYEGKIVGLVGTLHPSLAKEFKIRGEVCIAELNLDLLLQGQPRSAKSKSPAKFPVVERDLAFVMPIDLKVADVLGEIKKSAGQVLQSAFVFDVFSGKPLGEGERSVAFRMKLQDREATLSEEQLSALQAKVISSVSQKFNIAVR